MATSFLPDVLSSAQIRIRAAFGVDPRSNPSGWTWTDITSDVMQDSGRTIDIQIGRDPESATAPPAQCTLAVNNSTGNYTQFSPLSTYYPNVREGTPIEVQLFVSGTWYTRFFGFVKSFAPSWDTTGNYAIAVITAYGVTRRLTQGSAPFRSPLYRAIAQGQKSVVGANLLAYWPFEDGSSAVSAASAVAGVPDVGFVGPVKFGQSGDAPPGSDMLADISSGGTATIAPPSGMPHYNWYLTMAIKYPPNIPVGTYIPSVRVVFNGATPGAYPYVDIIGANDADSRPGLGIAAPTPLGSFTGITGQPGVDGIWHYIGLSGQNFGIDDGFTTDIDGFFTNSVSSGATLDPVSAIIINPNGIANDQLPCIGHIALWDLGLTGFDVNLLYPYYLGSPGEDPSTRMTRLSTEQGENLTCVDGSDPSIAMMGPQGLKSFIDLIRECEASDAGYLYDGLDNGVDYQKLNGRYNIAPVLTLDASLGQVQPPFAPTSDDLGRVNEMTVNRTNGGTAVATDATGVLGTDNVGTYDNSLTVNTDSDGYLLPRASWEVAKGTFNGFRYPTLALDLRTIPTLAVNWLTVLPGSPIAVKLPYAAQLPAATPGLIVEGWTEHLTNLVWTVNPVNCIPQDTYQIATYASAPGPTASKFDAENSTVGTGFNTTATSLSIASATGTVLWTTDVAEFPFDINIGGERMTVSAISGTSSPQTFTISARSVNGIVKAHISGEAVHLWTIARFAL